MRRFTLVASALLVAATLAGCGDDDAGTATTAAPPTAAPTTAAPTTEPGAEVTEATSAPTTAAPGTTAAATAQAPPGTGTAPPPETGSPVTNPEGSEPALAEISVFSAAFDAGGSIPIEYTCDGANEVPEVRFDRVPTGTTSLALTVVDPDGGDWVHWVIWNLPPMVGGLPAGTPAGDLPNGARQASNDYIQAFAPGDLFPAGAEVRINGWDGPCPGPSPHQYVFTAYALTGTIDLPTGTPAADILAAIEAARADGSLIGEGSLLGLYPAP